MYQEKHKQIAPKIVRGTHPPSFASDVYSFGLILKSVAVRVSSDENLMDFVRKSLNKKPEQRPSFREICADRIK